MKNNIHQKKKNSYNKNNEQMSNELKIQKIKANMYN